MPNEYIAHKEEWKALADIDYFGMFVKAYIPFNAWMNVSYPALDSDRAKINAIKKDPNPFRNKICALLNADNQEGYNFRSLLGELHDMLENHYIHNQDKRISFTCVTLGKNPQNVATDNFRGLGYRVQYGNNTGNTQTFVLIKNKAGQAIVNINQANYNIEELKNHPDFISIEKQERKDRLINCYKQVEPYLTKDFTTGFNTNDARVFFQCGNFKFAREDENLAKGIIEIIYNMRNSLFHGELIPDKEANATYGAAYKIMRILIDAI